MLTESGITRKEINITISKFHKKHLAKLIELFNNKLPVRSRIKVFLSKKIGSNVNAAKEDLYKMRIEGSELSSIEDFINAIKKGDISYFK